MSSWWPDGAGGNGGSVPDLFSSFPYLADGALPTDADSGQPWILADNGFGTLPRISSKRMTITLGATTRAGYAQALVKDGSHPVTRVSALIDFAGGSTTGGTICLAVWKGGTFVQGAVPDSPAHISFTRTTMTPGTWTGGTITNNTAHTYQNQDGTSLTLGLLHPYLVEVVIDYVNGVQWIHMPDGQWIWNADATAAVKANAGEYVNFEILTAASTDNIPGFRAVSADTRIWTPGAFSGVMP